MVEFFVGHKDAALLGVARTRMVAQLVVAQLLGLASMGAQGTFVNVNASLVSLEIELESALADAQKPAEEVAAGRLTAELVLGGLLCALVNVDALGSSVAPESGFADAILLHDDGRCRIVHAVG